MLQNETIRGALSAYLVDQLYENVNVEKEARRSAAEGPQGTRRSGGRRASPGRRRRGRKGAGNLDRPERSGKTPNRTAHEQLLAVVENKKEAVSTDNGEVTLNLGSLLTNLAGQIGLAQDARRKAAAGRRQITILTSDQLKTAQDIVVAIKGLALVLSILTFLVFGAGDLPLPRRALGHGALQRRRADRRRRSLVIVASRSPAASSSTNWSNRRTSSRRPKRPGRSAPR